MSRARRHQPAGRGREPRPDILSMLQQLDASSPPLLDELERADLIVLLDEMLAWLNEVDPRVRRYVTRRARRGQSHDLDAQMVGDIAWYRLLRANFALLRDRLLQGLP